MLVRIHQSGHLAQISPAGFNMVAHGISVYKSIRDDIKRSIPFYPTGMPHFSDEWFSFGLNCGDTIYLAVWRISGENTSIRIPLGEKTIRSAECIYPKPLETQFSYTENTLNVSLNPKTARLFKIQL